MHAIDKIFERFTVPTRITYLDLILIWIHDSRLVTSCANRETIANLKKRKNNQDSPANVTFHKVLQAWKINKRWKNNVVRVFSAVALQVMIILRYLTSVFPCNWLENICLPETFAESYDIQWVFAIVRFFKRHSFLLMREENLKQYPLNSRRHSALCQRDLFSLQKVLFQQLQFFAHQIFTSISRIHFVIKTNYRI